MVLESTDGASLYHKSQKLPQNIPQYVKPLEVIERDTTKIIPPAGFIVREALAFIRSNANKGISVDDVVKHIGVSRWLLYLRFRQMHGKSIHGTILDTRLELAMGKLGELDGRQVTIDIVDSIFHRFCVGK